MNGSALSQTGTVLRGLRQSDLPALREALQEVNSFTEREKRVALAGFASAVHGDGEERACGGIGLGGEIRCAACYTRAPLSDHVWVITWLFVRPAWERRSLGRSLVAHVEGEAVLQGGTLLVVETSGRPGLGGAVAFWKACGLQVAAEIADFYSPGEPLLLLTKRLRR